MALGLGEGFTQNMKNISKDMNKAIPTSFDTDVNLNGKLYGGNQKQAQHHDRQTWQAR